MRVGTEDSAAREEREIEELIRAARGGCQASLGQLIATGRNYLLAVANRELPAELRPKLAPSDLVQESIIEAHRDFAGFAGARRNELLAWLRRILLHNLANAQRKYRETAKRDLAREVPLNGVDSATGRAVQLPQQGPTPSSVVSNREQAERLEAAVARLSPDDQLVIVLRHREHLPFEQIAEQLQKSVVATRKLWSRAIERLRQELDVDDER